MNLVPDDLKGRMTRNHYDVTERGIEQLFVLHGAQMFEGHKHRWIPHTTLEDLFHGIPAPFG